MLSAEEQIDAITTWKRHFQWLVFLADASGHGGAAAVLAALARMICMRAP